MIVTRIVMCMLLASCAAANAQGFPNKIIRLITIGGPGSGTDLAARAAGEGMSRGLGQTIIVEARTGAGGTIAANYVLNAEPDGHTVLVASPAHVASGLMYKNLTYDAVRDFSGITPLVEQPTVMVVPVQRGWRNVKDVIAAAKAKPGAYNYGSAGTGSGTHMSAVRFRLAAGIEAQHVAYKSTPEVIAEVMGGRIDWHFSPLASAIPLIKDGRLRAVALSAPERSTELPELPTFAEQGLKDAEFRFWIGMLVSAKVPRAVVQRLYEEAARAAATPAVRERFSRMGATPFILKPAEYDAFLKSESDVAATIIKAANIQVQ